VLVEEKPPTKAGSLVDPAAAIRLTSDHKYVGRGGEKLEKALAEFAIAVEGRTALDVGASTGGFTDCLLARGARRVYAVDVGRGQLAAKLRADPRVLVFEKTDIRHMDADRLTETPELATIDASFISLRLILPAVARLLAEGGEIVALIKPQFEVGKEKIGKGVVRSGAEHARVIAEIEAAALTSGFQPLGVVESPLLGAKGNKEFFIHLRKVD
jgi:23S rRNA (cytidine1920-2'-O)/16S rRNA (cytidine1409-2'-O)-methyltransferase